MTVYSFLQKNQKAFFRGALFAVVFFSSLLLSQKPVAAQNVFYPEFECLFTSSTTTPCDHSASNIDIKSGTKSGIVYGKIPSGTEYIDATGVKAVTMILGLAMDISKINTIGTNDPEYSNRNNYFWSRVADDPDDTFVVRLGYTKPGTTTPTYKLQTISAKKESVSFSTPLGIPASVTLALKLPFTINTTKNTAGQQEKIAFFTKGGDHAINSQVVQVVMDSPGNVSIPYGSTMTADLWYCAGLQDYAPNHDGRYTPRTPTTIPGDQRVEYFTTDGVYTYKDGSGNAVKATDGYKYDEEKCGGTAHYKIGNTVTFSLPKDVTAAQSDQTTTIDTGIKASENISPEDNLPSCGLVNGTVVGCIAQGVYYLIFNPIQWVAGIIGRAFDFFLGYSISDESYRAEVIVTGWKLVRDISNIFFILILVWTGLSTVFGFSKVSMRSIVPQLIINALLINFSLFGARVVIDISNVTARLFYNTMSVCQGTCDYKIDDATGKKILTNPNTETTAGFKPLSAKIVSAFDPQKIFNPKILSPDNTSNTTNNTQQGSADLQRGASSDLSSNEYAGYFLIVTLIAAFIMFGIAKMFFGVMFMFVGRVVGLYMVMIFAPFAIMTRGGMPLVGDMKDLGWKDWSSDLVKYSVLAPVFVFFLYIIYSFINSNFVQGMNLDKEAGFMGTVLGIVIPMFIIYMLVQQGVKIAQKYAGKAGEMFQKFGSSATGLVGGAALGVATGGLAFAGTRAAGLAKMSEVTRTKLIDQKAQGGLSGRWASMRLGLNDKAQSGSFDARNSKLFGSITKKLDIPTTDKISGVLGLGVNATKGGMKAIEKKDKEDIKKKIESIQTSMKDSDAEAYWKKKVDEMINKQGIEDQAKKKMKEGGKSDEEIAKLTSAGIKESVEYKTALADAQKNIEKDYGKVKNNKQLTQAMRIQFAQTIADGNTLGQQLRPVKGVVGAAGGGAGLGTATNAFGFAGLGVAGAVLGAAGYEASRKNKIEEDEARSYASKAKKGNEKGTIDKETRLEEQKKEAEKKIAEMDKHLESINKTLKDIFTAETKSSTSKHFGKSPDTFDTDPEIIKEILKTHRQNLEDLNGELDLDIKSAHDEYVKARKEGRAADAEVAKRERAELIAQKGRNSQAMNDLNKEAAQEKRKKATDDLNRAESELDKLKKDKESKETKTPEPKDDKKK